MNKQVELTQSVLQACDTREKIREKITKLFDHPRYDPPFRRGNKYFYFHNTGLQAQNVLYVQVGFCGLIWIMNCTHFMRFSVLFCCFFPRQILGQVGWSAGDFA